MTSEAKNDEPERKLKRGKLSLAEADTIRKHAASTSIVDIAAMINRSVDFVANFCKENKLTYTGMSEDLYDDTILSAKLCERPYWFEVQQQFSEQELEYFIATWIRVMKQFKENILYSEELQVKQWITLEIMANRVMKERKAADAQIERLQTNLNLEYQKDLELREAAVIMGMETELSALRNSLGTFTTEHLKILTESQKVQTQLKAARTDRIKKVEDSKSSWSAFIKALEDELTRAKVGEDAEIMRLAKEQVKGDLSKFHTFKDGCVDQPFLTPENAIEE